MVFSSTIFLVYFLPFFLITYWLTPQKYRNITALIWSLAFYAWGAPKFVLVLLGVVACSVVSGRKEANNAKHYNTFARMRFASFCVLRFSEGVSARSTFPPATKHESMRGITATIPDRFRQKPAATIRTYIQPKPWPPFP